MLAHVANVGPLAVNVDASPWHSYTGGVFDGCDFNQNMDLNHVVQLVGYTEVSLLLAVLATVQLFARTPGS